MEDEIYYFNQLKKLIMPLGPKQQPPYYTKEPIVPPTPNGNYTRLHYDNTVNVTSGTAETDLYTYTLPANTLNNNGDQLIITMTGVNGSPVDQHQTRFKWAGITEAANDETVLGDFLYIIKITKTDTDQATIITQFWQETGNGNGKPDIIIDSPFDYTQTIEIKFTGQCPTTGTIQSTLWTIDKIIN